MDDRDDVLGYVNVEDKDGDTEAVEAVRVSEHVVGRVQHDVWKVTMARGRSYWVITNPMASYDAEKFWDSEALSMHIGSNVMLSVRDRGGSPY